MKSNCYDYHCGNAGRAMATVLCYFVGVSGMAVSACYYRNANQAYQACQDDSKTDTRMLFSFPSYPMNQAGNTTCMTDPCPDECRSLSYASAGLLLDIAVTVLVAACVYAGYKSQSSALSPAKSTLYSPVKGGEKQALKNTPEKTRGYNSV